MKVSLNKKILNKNQECALQNSAFFAEKKLVCINVISSPGSGKTTILAKTISDLKEKLRIVVIEGDIKTDTDTKRIKDTGAPAVQIETDGACHLSAEQVNRALSNIPVDELDIIFIENVGNLVCPAAFDLGEKARIVVLSVPEGDDKPIKYPGTFASADVVIINKIDLLNHVSFNLQRVIADIHVLNPDAKIFQVSATTGEGMQNFYDWLVKKRS